MQVKIGKIVNTHGIKGELRILTNSDFVEKRFSQGQNLDIIKKDIKQTLIISSSYKHKQFIIVKLLGYDNINDVEKFKNTIIYGSKMENLAEDEFLNVDLLNLMLIDDVTNKRYSSVIEVIENPAHNLLRFSYNNKLYLIPFNKEFISKVDLENNEIYFTNMKGLIDED